MSRASDGNRGSFEKTAKPDETQKPIGSSELDNKRNTDDIEDIVDAMIDSLRGERCPADPKSGVGAELLGVTRLVKSVRRQAEPSPEFGRKLVDTTVAEAEVAGSSQAASHRAAPGQWKPYARLVAGIAAALVLFVTLIVGPKLWNNDIAHAMSKVVAKITSYHGVLEKNYTTLSGGDQVIQRVEVWSSGDMYATKLEDETLTVNNGEKKWQVRPADKVVAILPVAPDPDRWGFDLKDQAKRAMEYPHTVVGEGVVAGRNTVCLEITPPGGLPYHLWVDAETDLPMQLRTAIHNGIQTTYTYSEFEANAEIDQAIFEYKVPTGFAAVDNDPGQEVATPTEALGIAGFIPVLPDGVISLRIVAHTGAVQLLIPGDDGLTVVTEKPAIEDFEAVSYAALGRAAGGPMEVLYGHLRWQQEGLQITVEGPDRVSVATLLTPDLVMPEDAVDPGFAPQVEVSVDMKVVTNDQQQVDGGHSPWQLDPISVALTFVNLEATSDGIAGKPHVGYDRFSVESNDGVHCTINVAEGSIAKMYLQRIVRPDETGIWSVIGYDLR